MRVRRQFMLRIQQDPDEIGFVQWRPAFYAVGGSSQLDNALLLLDAFFQYLATAMAKEKCFEVRLYTPARS